MLLLLLLSAFIHRFYRLDLYPPGVQHDEVFVSNFAETILRGQYPIFFDLNRGNEPLFMYLVAIAFRLLGENVWALRATSALCGSAALVVTFLLIRDSFSFDSIASRDKSQDQKTGNGIALLTVAGLAFSFWLLYETRVGLHAISTYLLASLTFFSFWRGWTRGSRLWLVGSGFLAGLSAYTYRSGIFVPFALGAFVLYTFVFHRKTWKNNVWVAPIVFLIAGLVYAPLGYYIFTHPETSLARLGDLSGDISSFLSGDPFPILRNALAVFEMFGVRGDPDWRYNVALRPVFDPIWAVFFYIGVVIALWRMKRPAYAFTLIWLGVMILPSILSGENPSQHRSVGAIGAAYVFPAITLTSAINWVRARSESWSRAFVLVAAALVFLASVEGVRDYFLVWPENLEVRRIYRADLAEAAHWLDENDTGERVMVSAEFANDLDRGAFNLEAARGHDVHFFSGADTFVIPASGTALYVDPSSGKIADEFKREFFGTPQRIFSITVPGRQDELAIYRPSLDDLEKWRSKAPNQLNATSPDGQIGVLGAEVPGSIQSGQTLRLRMWWQVRGPPLTDGDALSWTTSLVDSTGYNWSETAGLGYTPSQWQPGDLIISAFGLDIPADTPPEIFQVQARLSVRGQPYPFHIIENTDVPAIPLGKIRVTRGAVPLSKPDLPIRYPLKANFGDSIQLLGSDAAGSAPAGEVWRVVLFWKALQGIPEDYRITMKGVGEDGKLIAESAPTLLVPTYPTHVWRAGEYLRTVNDLSIPTDAHAGKAVVRIYLVGPDAKPIGRPDGVPVAGIEIGGRAHDFSRPTPTQPLVAHFGAGIGLLGYDLASSTAAPGGNFSVTLYWEALGEIDKSYTVFVHVLDENGRIIGQKDSPPLGGQAPTDTWQTGEFLTDRYEFSVSPHASLGPASLEFGLYDPSDGTRLAAVDEHGKPIGDHVSLTGLAIGP